MAKTVASIEKALKLRANNQGASVSIRVGRKVYSLPFEVRTLNSDGFLFVHLPSAAGIYEVNGKELKAVSETDTAVKAQASFRSPRKSTKRGKARPAEVPAEIAEALAKIPSGYRLGFDAKGAPRLVKVRKRAK